MVIRIDSFCRKVHETNIDSGIRNTVHNPSFITTRIVSQVIISNIKVPDAARITDLEYDVFEGLIQYIPSQKNFTPKEIHSDVNSSYDIER